MCDIRYSISDTDDLKNKIVPFFEKYPLCAKKRFDFQLWKEAVEILRRNRMTKLNRIKGEKGFRKVNWRQNDLKILKKIYEEMQKYKYKNINNLNIKYYNK